MQTPLAIDIQQLNVKLGSKPILHDLSVSMPPGAIGLLGPNGAGKSTLLKTMMGFLPPQSGSIQIFGMDPRVKGAVIRQILGYMPEEDTYIAGMSAVEFVSYCGLLCGLPPKQAKLRAHQTLHYCGLGEARYRKIDTYSTGMRQRIKLAQALVHDPKLLFLDEPTNGLDPQGRKDMLELIKDISHNKGISVILSSHLLPDVEDVCDSVMVLFKGRLAKAGKIRDLKKLAHTVYEVGIKGDRKPFETAMQPYHARCEASKKNGILRVLFSEEIEPMVIFQAAQAAGVQIRHLAREELTLQEIFASAIQDPQSPVSNPSMQ
ncbi:MAG: ABC transporter ATP-binding protein [bacterium]|jgi:ABC-2 type transport system ATP-binding protein|nr:ABC transporter ATP-binding protein [bacterium]